MKAYTTLVNRIQDVKLAKVFEERVDMGQATASIRAVAEIVEEFSHGNSVGDKLTVSESTVSKPCTSTRPNPVRIPGVTGHR